MREIDLAVAYAHPMAAGIELAGDPRYREALVLERLQR